MNFHLLGFGLCYLVFANCIAIFLFDLDKRRAVMNEWRISESTLLAVAFLGGWPGAKYGQRKFRHKTRKQPFATQLNAIAILQMLLILSLLIPDVRRQVSEFTSRFPIPTETSKPMRMPVRFGPGS